MKLLLKPYWVFVCVTIPQLLLFWIFFRIFNTISSQLTPENIKAWVIFGSVLGILWLGAAIYGAFALIKKKAVNSIIGFPILAAYIAFLYAFLWQSRMVIPWSIPDWMLFGIQPEIYMLTFIMPALSYGLILLVFRYLPGKDGYTMWKDLLGAVAIPIGWYVIVMVLMPFMRQVIYLNMDTRLLTHTGAILFITSSVLFLFLLSRLICVLLANKPKIWHIIRIPIVIVLPVLGLLLNNGVTGLYSIGYSFGDFSHPAFYIFALLTGGLLLLPPFENKAARLTVFFGKCLTFAYTAYFFTVFLPFLPLSIAAVIAAGLGFLMLTPLMLMLIHIRSLWDDVIVLGRAFKKYQLALVFIVGVAILPAAVAISFNNDRLSLNGALQYVYEPDYNESSGTGINPVALKHTLDNIRINREVNGRLGRIASDSQTPYLTSFYRWLVLDNLTLSDKKITALENIFLGDTDIPRQNMPQAVRGSEDINVKSIRTETVISDDGKSNKSWIHFEIENLQSSQQEYTTNFVLPSGCWISNYYLDVAGVRKYGILADKRTAVWIYDQITSWRRDPGILYYQEDNSIAFKVFPFEPNEVRKTGIEVLHKGDVALNIDGNEIVLHGQGGSVNGEETVFSSDGKSAFVPAAVKSMLPKVIRKPHYVFILDYSGRETGGTADLLNRTAAFIHKQGDRADEATILAVNNEIRQITENPGWQAELTNYSSRGGFFLDRAVRKALLENEASGRQERAVIIVVSDNIDKAVLLDDFKGFKKAFPDDTGYYELHKDGMLYECQLLSGVSEASMEAVDVNPQKPVLAWPDRKNPKAFLPDDGLGSLVLLDPEQNYDENKSVNATWDNGLILAAMNLSLDLNPSHHYRKSMAILKNSFNIGIMAPQTSYIVVENEAQEQALLEKQRQLLASQKSLDAGNAESRMTEPSIIFILLAGAVLYLLKRRKHKQSLN